MTEKRFYINGVGISDRERKRLYDLKTVDGFISVTDLLNEQHETILSLHKTIEELDNCQKGQSHRINDLYLENKQLKDLITYLGYTIKYDGYRHISLELKR